MATARARYEITAVDRTRHAFRSAQSGIERVNKAVFALRSAFVALAGVGGIGAVMGKAFDLSRQLATISTTLGITTGDLAALKVEAAAAGVALTQVTTAIQRMTRRIAEAARGTGEATGALRELGINAAALKRRRPEEAFIRVLEALKGVEGSFDRNRLAMKLFDSEGVQAVSALIPRINEVSRALRDTNQGLTESVKKTEELRKKWDELKSTVALTGLHIAGFIHDITLGFDRGVRRTIDMVIGDTETLRVEITKAAGVAEDAADAQLRFIEQLRLAAIEGASATARHAAQLEEVSAQQLSVNLLINRQKVETRDLTSAARDLGFTFSSAFEDAIVQGRGVRKILQGMLQDITRIMLRMTITQPFANALASAIGGGFASFTHGQGTAAGALPGAGLGDVHGFAHGGSFTVPGSGGIDSRLVGFRATPGERVTVEPAGSRGGAPVTVNVNLSVNALDARSVSQLLFEQRGTLIGILNDAARRSFRRGI